MPKSTHATLDPALEAVRDTGNAVPAGDETYVMPATQGQVRFWSLDQMNLGNPALNMPLMWQFTGDLDVDALRRAFARCVDRHESLRTTFAAVKGKLSQVIHPVIAMPIPVEDVTALRGEDLRLEQYRLTRAHAAFRFNLRQGPLLVLKLLKLAPRHHLLLVTMHHIICDGISNGVLMRDMIAFYEADVQHTNASLPELPIQFADYAVWQEEWRRGPEHAASMEFWHETLGRDFRPLRLPHDEDADEARPAHRVESTGDIETLLLPRDLTARAHAFCAKENVTLNVLLFSVFATLLSRLTSQKDIAIGSPCANRSEETEDLIGLFMNIQVMRLQLEDSSTFRDVLEHVRRWTLAASENQTLPFEDLVHDRFFSESGTSLEIPIFFLYQKSFMLVTRIVTEEGELEIVPLRSESPGAVFEWMFAIVDRQEEGPRLQLEYDPRHFKPGTIQRQLRLFVNLLEAALENPATRVDTLNLLSAADRQQLLLRGSQTAKDFGEFNAFHRVFLERARLAPDGIAVECDGKRCSNSDLAASSLALAERLVREGVRPGDLVAIYAGRSEAMLVAILGVWMAGAAYLPLDPRHPVLRTNTILEQSGTRHILSDREQEFPANIHAIQMRSVPAQARGAFRPLAATPDSLAYVIYTSGSTGVPKGVAIEHGALMNLLQSMAVTPGLQADDVLVAVTTFAFDIAAMELLLPLLTGARLVIATEQQVQAPAVLLRLLHESRATALQATPGAWRGLIDAGWDGKQPLKALCGGEALSRDLADRLLARSSEVWNMYGPTETTIWSSATHVLPGKQAITVGLPIANTQFYVLDQMHQPVPVGVEGELYIGGAGVARGYWQDDAQTAARFHANPFHAGRMYQTGDRARWHANGAVELLGRTDFQVKVRGYRIELGEIEAALEQHKLVQRAVVVQHVTADQPESAGVTRLVAYVATGEPATDEQSSAIKRELEDHLSVMLPDYMQPNAIVVMEQLPLNTNGKIDRSALPEVFTHAGDAGIRLNSTEPKGFMGPRDDIERQLTQIWQKTLGIARISIRASFFTLGVGSLAALRLITRMNRVYGMDLGLASLLSASSIESIADLIRNRFSANMSSALVPIKPEGTRPPLFIVHGVGGNVINFYGLAMRMNADQPVYGIQSQALLPGQPALLRLEDMAAHYLECMRAVQPVGPYHLLGYSFGATVVLEMAQQLRAAGESIALLGMLDGRTKGYDAQFKEGKSTQTKIDERMQRLRGNTTYLSWRGRLTYIAEKLHTRALRFTSKAVLALGARTLPAFLKDANEINLVAITKYTPQPFDGHMVLFRAAEQDFADGPADLGWSSVFKQGVTVHNIPGDHERIFLEPSIDILAGNLRDELTERDEL